MQVVMFGDREWLVALVDPLGKLHRGPEKLARRPIWLSVGPLASLDQGRDKQMRQLSLHEQLALY